MILQRHLFVVGTFLLSVLLYMDRVCISVAEDAVRSDVALSKEQMGWVMSAFALGYALCQAPAGLLADRFGARRILSLVVVAWSAFTGLTAAAWNFVSLVIVRLLFGAGEAGAFPGVARAVYSWLPMAERGLVQGINFSGSRLGAALALPVVAGSIGTPSNMARLRATNYSIFWQRVNRPQPPQRTRCFHFGDWQTQLPYGSSRCSTFAATSLRISA